MTMYRSKAPLRLGLAGGGTDVSPYCDQFGGSILNATLNMYAYANIEPLADPSIELVSIDRNVSLKYQVGSLPIEGKFDLAAGVYNRLRSQYHIPDIGFRLTTFVDAPAGSGLGSSSTLVVAILGCFSEWFKIPLGEYDMAHLAYEIERIDLGLSGGRQDQYAATFGGFNFMEFYKDDKVIVNPLRVKQKFVSELENNLLLFYTGTSRESAEIIKKQSHNIEESNAAAIEATHKLKEQSVMMKEALLTGQIDRIGEILHFGWENKKRIATGISNSHIEEIYDTAIKAGANGGKISGAGGGGFIIFYCPGNSRYPVFNALKKMNLQHQPLAFTREGCYSYSV